MTATRVVASHFGDASALSHTKVLRPKTTRARVRAIGGDGSGGGGDRGGGGECEVRSGTGEQAPRGRLPQQQRQRRQRRQWRRRVTVFFFFCLMRAQKTIGA